MQIVPSVLKLRTVRVPEGFRYETGWNMRRWFGFPRPSELTALSRIFPDCPEQARTKPRIYASLRSTTQRPFWLFFVPVLLVLQLGSACLLRYRLGKSPEFCSSCESRIKTRKKMLVVSFGMARWSLVPRTVGVARDLLSNVATYRTHTSVSPRWLWTEPTG